MVSILLLLLTLRLVRNRLIRTVKDTVQSKQFRNLDQAGLSCVINIPVDPPQSLHTRGIQLNGLWP